MKIGPYDMLEKMKAKEIVDLPNLKWQERLRMLQDELGWDEFDAQYLLEPIYLARKTGLDLVREEYKATGRADVRYFIDSVRKERIHPLSKIEKVAEGLNIPKEIAIELLYPYHGRWSPNIII